MNFKAPRVIIATVVAFVISMLGQAAEPQKPGPEQKRLEIWSGKWSYQGKEVETPLGVKGDFKGQSTARMLAGGFVLEIHDVDETPQDGKASDWLTLIWYDVATKGYLRKSFQPSGAVASAPVTVDGNTWTSAGELRDTNGKVWKTRSATTFSADGNSTTTKQEYSPDGGNTWLIWWTYTAKKLGK